MIVPKKFSHNSFYYYKEPHLQTMWWKELRAKIHFDIVEDNNWHTIQNKLDNYFLQAYRMTHLAYNPFWSNCVHF